MSKPYATLRSGEMISTTSLREPIRIALENSRNGLGEALLVHLVRIEDRQPLGAVTPAYLAHEDDPWTSKVRQTCKLLGARRDERGVWRMAA